MCIQGWGLYIKPGVRHRAKSAMQFFNLYQSKFHRQNRSTFLHKESLCAQDPDTQTWTSSVIKQAGLYSSWAQDKFVSWCFHLCQEVLFPSILRQPHHNLTPSKAPNRSLRTLRQAYLLSCLQWPWQHSQSRSNWKPAPWVQTLGCWEGYQQCPSQGWMWPQTDSWLTVQQKHLSVYHSLDDLAAA